VKIQVTDNRIIAPHLDIQDGVYSLELWKEKRSNAQNALMHVVFRESAIGFSVWSNITVTPSMAKELLKERFLKRNHEILGEYTLKTSKLNTKEAVHFIEDCVRYLSVKCGYYIDLREDWQRSILE